METERNKKKEGKKRPAPVPSAAHREEEEALRFSKGAVNESTTKDRKNVNGDPDIIQGNRLDEEDAQP